MVVREEGWGGEKQEREREKSKSKRESKRARANVGTTVDAGRVEARAHPCKRVGPLQGGGEGL